MVRRVLVYAYASEMKINVSSLHKKIPNMSERNLSYSINPYFSEINSSKDVDSWLEERMVETRLAS